jgi:hypothetical protein
MQSHPHKYTTMFLALLTMITALSISAVAIYYSVAGLVAIFAAAAVPIMIMGGTLEIAKLVTAVWLHRYWSIATWWLRTYLALAVVILMFITSMGIFGFLSKAHIEQTSASTESVAQVERLATEITRQNDVVKRAEEKINALQTSGTGSDANIQSQIDKEQNRIDLAFDRIKPAIAQQNTTIENARTNDTTRTKPYEDQLTNIQAEVLRLETSAKEYEQKITTLEADSGAIQPLLDSIKDIEEEIIRVTNQLQSSERDQIRAGQAIIGVSSDGAFGGNTRRALVAWVEAQRARITQVQLDVSQLRQDATAQVDAERTRLAGVVKDIRIVQIPALKDREVIMLAKIDEVRQTESPTIATARDEIQRLRTSAEAQVAQSQTLIERLRGQLAQTDKAIEIDAAVDEQGSRIKTANAEIDILTEEKYKLEGEYRKLEAEVGPIKYIAEFVYGEQADKNMLEKAVTWVIVIIIFVFDPLAVLLLIASQYTFEFYRKQKEEQELYEQARAERMAQNVPTAFTHTTVDNASTNDDVGELLPEQDIPSVDEGHSSLEQTEVQPNRLTPEQIAEPYVGIEPDGPTKAVNNIPNTINRMFYPEELDTKKKSIESSEELRLTEEQLDKLDELPAWNAAKQGWKDDHPNETLKDYKLKYLHGIINKLPWEDYLTEPHLHEDIEKSRYIQNQEQNENSIWNRIGDK